ncbi:MAG: prolyl oligopeptidase family serine peptidase [Bacteroidota bacterium]
MRKFLYLFLFVIVCCTNKNETSPISNPANEEVPIVATDAIYDVTKAENITYAQGLSHQTINSDIASTVTLELDAYVPNNNSDNRPAIVLIHGGSFEFGSKTVPAMVNLANFFASRGWVAFSINYRLKKAKGTVPEAWVQYARTHLNLTTAAQSFSYYPANRDAKAAIRWLYANAENYGVNADYLTVGGGSAGAAIAIMLGASEAEDYTEEISLEMDPTLSTTHLDQPSKVHTVLNFWGSLAMVNILEKVYGRQRFDENDAPVMIAHGTTDAIVDFDRAEALRDEYEATGVPFEFYPLVGEAHSAWDATVNGQSLEELSFDFIVAQQGLRQE